MNCCLAAQASQARRTEGNSRRQQAGTYGARRLRFLSYAGHMLRLPGRTVLVIQDPIL